MPTTTLLRIHSRVHAQQYHSTKQYNIITCVLTIAEYIWTMHTYSYSVQFNHTMAWNKIWTRLFALITVYLNNAHACFNQIKLYIEFWLVSNHVQIAGIRYLKVLKLNLVYLIYNLVWWKQACALFKYTVINAKSCVQILFHAIVWLNCTL